jgi:hypothetical protein
VTALTRALGHDQGAADAEVAQAAVVCGDGLLHVLGQVVPQVPAVGDLHRDAGMLPQPVGDGVSLPILEQIDRSAVSTSTARAHAQRDLYPPAGHRGVGQRRSYRLCTRADLAPLLGQSVCAA